jgi:branched-chain amino acid transport system permease protein
VIALDIAIRIIFDGAAYAMVLYITAVGLSVTMGLLGIANLAHGAFAMAGGYAFIALTNGPRLPFGWAILFACLIVAAVSAVLERVLYVRFYKAGELDQVVLSIGLIFVATALAQYFFGTLPAAVRLPAVFQGLVTVPGWQSFPIYRVFLIVCGLVVFAALWFGIEWTLLGAKIRAAVNNRAMAEAIGIDTRRLFTTVFTLGSALAALGGALGADVVAISPNYPLDHLVYFLIVVAVGGFGAVQGPFLAALLLGVGDTACRILVPQFGAFFVYVALFLILLARPSGLFGRA